MLVKRRSRYKKIPKHEKAPIRITKKDIEIFELYGPGSFKRFKHLTAQLIRAATGRPLNRVQHRLRDLSDNEDDKENYLLRYYPPHEKIGGSPKIVYRLGRQGAVELREHFMAEFDRKLATGEITLAQAHHQAEVYKKIKPIKNFNPDRYHQQMDHTLTTSWFRVLVLAACRQRRDIELLYQYPDHYVSFTFEHPKPNEEQIVLNPDTFFGWRQIGQVRPASNFLVEVQLPGRKAKESSSDQIRNIEKKLKDYRDFRYYRGYEAIPEHLYPDVKNWKDTRVLIFTNTSELEHQNLIEFTRDKVCNDGKGLKQFWFARKNDFDLSKPESLFAPVWRTTVEGDDLQSILS